MNPPGPLRRLPAAAAVRGRQAKHWATRWATERWQVIERRSPWLRRMVAAWRRMSVNHGNQYAAAITYFSFLAIFPLLLLAVSITGFVLHAHSEAEQSLIQAITDNIPGDFGTTLSSSVRTFISNRTSVGLIGLAGLLFTGLGWVGNLRAAVEVMWGHFGLRHNWFATKASDLLVLVGLGLAALLSVGFTVAGAALTGQIGNALGWGNARFALLLAGVAAALVGNFLIFLWLLTRLPRIRAKARPVRAAAVKGAVFAAIGLEILKLVGTYTIARTSRSLTAGPFASVIAVLIWLQLVARLVLLTAAWTAIASEDAAATEDTASPGTTAGAAAGGLDDFSP